uniref:Uncharacterized protein n=1 Tax=Arundo donax TaxID=35708 RepID=A0A0A9G3N3_ARUDO
MVPQLQTQFENGPSTPKPDINSPILKTSTSYMTWQPHHPSLSLSLSLSLSFSLSLLDPFGPACLSPFSFLVRSSFLLTTQADHRRQNSVAAGAWLTQILPLPFLSLRLVAHDVAPGRPLPSHLLLL